MWTKHFNTIIINKLIKLIEIISIVLKTCVPISTADRIIQIVYRTYKIMIQYLKYVYYY